LYLAVNIQWKKAGICSQDNKAIGKCVVWQILYFGVVKTKELHEKVYQFSKTEKPNTSDSLLLEALSGFC